jgi:hypothetical protein
MMKEEHVPLLLPKNVIFLAYPSPITLLQLSFDLWYILKIVTWRIR